MHRSATPAHASDDPAKQDGAPIVVDTSVLIDGGSVTSPPPAHPGPPAGRRICPRGAAAVGRLGRPLCATRAAAGTCGGGGAEAGGPRRLRVPSTRTSRAPRRSTPSSVQAGQGPGGGPDDQRFQPEPGWLPPRAFGFSNLNDLANALKPIATSGEGLDLTIVKEGKSCIRGSATWRTAPWWLSKRAAITLINRCT